MTVLATRDVGLLVQEWSPDLTAIAALRSSASKVLTSTGTQTWALVDSTSLGVDIIQVQVFS